LIYAFALKTAVFIAAFEGCLGLAVLSQVERCPSFSPTLMMCVDWAGETKTQTYF